MTAKAERSLAELASETTDQALRMLAMLASAQLILEDLRDSDPEWKAAIRPPADAAKRSWLEALLRIAAARGIVPDPERDDFGPFAEMLAYGVYLTGRLDR